MSPEDVRRGVILLAITAVASYGLLRLFAPPEAERAPMPLARQDNEILKVEMRVYGDDGQPELVLVSPRITSPRRSDDYLIESPLFDVVTGEGVRWHGAAQRGRLDVARDRLWLEQDVALTGRRGEQAPMEIRTSMLEFRLDTRLAWNEEAVEIRQAGNRLAGVGLTADLEKDSFVLRSQVEGLYAVQRKRK